MLYNASDTIRVAACKYCCLAQEELRNGLAGTIFPPAWNPKWIPASIAINERWECGWTGFVLYPTFTPLPPFTVPVDITHDVRNWSMNPLQTFISLAAFA